MDRWEPTAEQKRGWESDGYFVVPCVIPAEQAIEVRGVIKDKILRPDETDRVDADPAAPPTDPLGDSVAARAARYRKLSNYCLSSPLIWHTVHGSEAIARMARWLLGDDILLKFNSCFTKPARTGSATPWHQDNGLWRDGEVEAFNFWVALDPSTRRNGCLQFIPGSHKAEIVPHVLYKDSIHGEIPRDLVSETIRARGVHHVELDQGDAVCWHSSLWHYSPANTSDRGRIGIAGVYTTPAIAERSGRRGGLPWVVRSGRLSAAFPPEMYHVQRQGEKVGPFPRVDSEAA